MDVNDKTTSISALKEMIDQFNADRGWKRWQKALSLAISIDLEASELLEIFQWADKEEADRLARETEREHFVEELADVMIYCINMANSYDVDIASAIADKLGKNAKKYPVQSEE